MSFVSFIDMVVILKCEREVKECVYKNIESWIL